MKLVIPKYVNIHGKRFTVKLVETYEFMGMMDYDNAKIYLSVHQTREQLVCTFIHEFLHALHYRVGIHQALSREMMEVLCESQAQAIVELFKLK